MPNLQYIGARYVPIVFSNPDDDSANWKSGISYENLVIVTYLDDSYTSRKPVPSSVGNPADNPEYWSKTGDFNAALTALQGRVNTLENTTIPNVVQDYTDKIDTINNKLNGSKIVANPTIILISDSYGVNDSTPGHLRYSWFDDFAPYAEYFGFNVLSQAEGGASFCGGNGGHKYDSALATLISSMTSEQKNNVVAVVIGGGYNDAVYYTNDTAVRNGITDFKTRCSNNFPNLKRIMFNFIGNTFNASNKTNVNNWIHLMRSYTEGYGIEYSTYGYGAMHDYDNIQTDGIHPTESGAIQIGRMIFDAFVNGGTAYSTIAKAFTLTAGGTTAIGGGSTKLNSANVELIFRSFTVTKTSSNASPVIATTDKLGYMRPMANYDFFCYGSVDSDAKVCFIRISTTADNKIQLIIRPMDTDPWQEITIDNVTCCIPVFEC